MMGVLDQPEVKPLEQLVPGDRVRVQGGRNFEKFHGGMEGDIIANNVEDKNIVVAFYDHANSAEDKQMKVAYRNLEHAPTRGGYRGATNSAAPSGQANAQKPPEPTGPQLEEHGEFRMNMVVRISGLQSAQELNGRCGRLKKYDQDAGRWAVDVRDATIKRLKEENISPLDKVVVDSAWSVEEIKTKGNESFKIRALEDAIVYYSAAIEKCEDDSSLPEAQDNKYVSVLYGNRSQCFINLAREAQGEDKAVRKETRMYSMRANMDAGMSIELDDKNGKAYYRRGCAMLGMAPSASRAKEAIEHIEIALTGRASGSQDTGIVLPNAMRLECQNLLDYAKRRLDSCVEAAIPDVEVCREQCKQQ